MIVRRSSFCISVPVTIFIGGLACGIDAA